MTILNLLINGLFVKNWQLFYDIVARLIFDIIRFAYRGDYLP